MVKIAWNPKHPERVCWGCDKYCRADRLVCGNGTERTQHPIELFGPDWLEWAREQGTYDDYEGFDPSADDSPRPAVDAPRDERTPEHDQERSERERPE